MGGMKTITLGEAVDSSLVNNQTLAYFMARTQLFLEKIGMDPTRLRFRQHLCYFIIIRPSHHSFSTTTLPSDPSPSSLLQQRSNSIGLFQTSFAPPLHSNVYNALFLGTTMVPSSIPLGSQMGPCWTHLGTVLVPSEPSWFLLRSHLDR